MKYFSSLRENITMDLSKTMVSAETNQPSEEKEKSQRFIRDIQIVRAIIQAFPNIQFIFNCPTCKKYLPEQHNILHSENGHKFCSLQSFIQFSAILVCPHCDLEYCGISNWSVLGLKFKN